MIKTLNSVYILTIQELTDEVEVKYKIYECLMATKQCREAMVMVRTSSMPEPWQGHCVVNDSCTLIHSYLPIITFHFYKMLKIHFSHIFFTKNIGSL